MENKSHALMAGLFTIALGIALALTALWLSRDNTERVHYELVTRASVSGLSPQSPVRFRGLDIGKVETIRFDPQVPGQILVRVAIEKSTPITHSTFAQLGYQGVTGLAYVQLDDDGKDGRLVATTDANPARLDIQPGLLDKLAGKGETVVVQVEETVRRLNQLLSPDNQKVFFQTLASLDNAAKEIGQIGPRLNPTLQRLPQVADAAQRSLTTIDATARDYDKLALRLQEKDGTLERLANSLDQFSATAAALNGSTLPRVDNLAEDAKRSARALTHTANVLGERPQSLLFGTTGAVPPGPGESGYIAPSANPTGEKP